MKTQDYLRIHDQHCAHNYSPLDVIIDRAKGCVLTDIEGNDYLDFHSAYSGLNFGHNHPRFVRAAREQLQKLCLTSRAFIAEPLVPFCKELSEFCGMEMVLPMNTGAEAVETALKIARKWGYERKGVALHQAEIICFTNNFHGRTISIVSFSDSPESRDGFGPYTPGFKLVEFGDSEAVRRAVNSNTVAILVEPIQGEAGILLPPDGFMKSLRQIADEHNLLLMADEIQTGFCRTGKRFACEYDHVQPDVFILAKSLGGGILPISAVVTSREIMSVITPGTHGSTFSGNPLACSIALEVLSFIKETKPEERSLRLGNSLMRNLKKANLSKVKAIRGKGLFIGVDTDPSYGPAKKLCNELMKEGLLCKDTRKYTIRLAPPLVIQQKQLDRALDALVRVLK